jgi:hypothetical protein
METKPTLRDAYSDNIEDEIIALENTVLRQRAIIVALVIILIAMVLFR